MIILLLSGWENEEAGDMFWVLLGLWDVHPKAPPSQSRLGMNEAGASVTRWTFPCSRCCSEAGGSFSGPHMDRFPPWDEVVWRTSLVHSIYRCSGLYEPGSPLA